MSSIVTTTTSAERARLREARPRFLGLVGGELLKITRMWSTWITLVLLLGAICLPYLVSLTISAFAFPNSLMPYPCAAIPCYRERPHRRRARPDRRR